MWSIEWRHFNDLERPLTQIAVTPLFDAEYLRDGTKYTHSYNEIQTGTYTCPTQVCHFKRPRVTSSELAKYLMTRSIARSLCDSWASCSDRQRGSLKQLKSKLREGVRDDLARHVYNVRHQFRAYKHLKETADVNEAAVHVDFSENYACKNTNQIQSAHCGASNKQATLHTGVMYTVDGHHSFTTISESVRYDPPAIWTHLKPVLHDLKIEHPEITDIHFFSHGPTTQYRNKLNFYLFSIMLKRMGFASHSPNFLYRGVTIDFGYKRLPEFAFGRFYSASGFGPDDTEIFYISTGRADFYFSSSFSSTTDGIDAFIV